jgi:tetratricopeptide (TPR) repeat protein
MSKKNKEKNKKQQHTVHKHTEESKHPVQRQKFPGEDLLGWIGVICLMVFLAVNIAMSQTIHPLYQGVTDGDKKSLVTFFKIAKNIPAFAAVKPDMEDNYRILAKEIDGENVTRQEKIKKIETLLQQYPNSRDLLYAASVLYTDIGDKEKSAEYLQKARAIDPSL